MNAEVTEKAHATYSASGSKRWVECAGSIKLAEKAPPEKESAFAAEGTEAHAVHETLLQCAINAPFKLPKLALELKKSHDPEMVDHALGSVNWIMDEAAKYHEPLVLCETEARYDHLEPGQFGTTDAAIVEEYGTLTVIDFKYGAGLVVYPDENTQGILYAIAIAHLYHYNFRRVRIVITQPRAEDDEGKTIRVWETSIDDLILWEKKLKKAIQATKKPDAPLRSGEWCRFCPAKTICPEISNLAFREAQTDFDDLIEGKAALPAVQSIVLPNLEKILAAADKIETWIQAVRDHAFTVLQKGEKVRGWKLVDKRGTRKWMDEAKVAKLALKEIGKDAFTEPSLKSPAQLEKLGKKAAAIAEKFSAVKSSGLTMVPESDKRSAVSSIDADFSVIDSDGKDVTKPKKGVKPNESVKTKTKTAR